MRTITSSFLAKLANLSSHRCLRRFLRARQGSAIVELAFGLPILFLILTGIFWFSIALYQKLELAEAVSVGGRFIAVDRGDTDPCAAAASKLYAAAPGLTQSNITLSFTINGVPSGPTCPGANGAANGNMISGANAEISASYPCKLIFFSAYGSSPSTACDIKAAVVEVVQ